MKKKTYDILGVGEHNRFFVRGSADSKPIMVHNCGYGMGASAFKEQIASQAKIFLEDDEAKHLVNTYRNKYAPITQFWNTADSILRKMIAGEQGYFGGPDGKLFFFDGTRMVAGKRQPGIRGPDGLWLGYTELQMKERTYADGTKKWNYCYYGVDGGRPAWIWLYGPKLVENLSQYLAFAIMKYQAMLIHQRYKIAFNVHDEWVTVAPETEADEALSYVVDCMKQLPEWAKGCPIDAEGAYAKSYGDC